MPRPRRCCSVTPALMRGRRRLVLTPLHDAQDHPLKFFLFLYYEAHRQRACARAERGKMRMTGEPR
jgi:hypothetical protein